MYDCVTGTRIPDFQGCIMVKKYRILHYNICIILQLQDAMHPSFQFIIIKSKHGDLHMKKMQNLDLLPFLLFAPLSGHLGNGWKHGCLDGPTDASHPFCNVHCRPKFLCIFTQFCPSPQKVNFLLVIGSLDHRAFSMYGTLYSLSSFFSLFPPFSQNPQKKYTPLANILSAIFCHRFQSDLPCTVLSRQMRWDLGRRCSA